MTALPTRIAPDARRSWSREDYERVLVGGMVRVDTPGDEVDRAHGLVMLSDAGVVVEVNPSAEPGRWRLHLADGFHVLVDPGSVLRVCRESGHGHEAGGCPVLAGP